MDLQYAVTVQEGAGDHDNSKDPVVAAAPTAPSLHGLLMVKPFPFVPGPMENQAVAMSNAGSTETLPSSPAEASLAKLATVSPTNTTTVTANGTDVDKSPTTSDSDLRVLASYTLASAATRLAETPTTPPPPPPPTTNSTTLPLATPPIRVVAVAVVEKKAAPAVLHFKGISVTLENNSVWRQFDAFRTEMILTKTGRRMFPYCRYRISGLVPDRRYNLVLSIVPADQYKYRWNTKKWEVIGSAEHQAPGLIRAFSHPNSPCLGSEWMRNLVSFYKLKLTNNVHDTEGHMVLHSMHRYIPRLHIIPVLDGNGPTADQPVIKGPESMTFTFPQTNFVSVTTYQNPWIIKLKINHNPFAKGFREDGFHPRQGKVKLKTDGSEGKNDPKPASNSSSMEIDPQETW
ncbi:hypothetical protein CRUP_024434 [Coryphaenoides rupestris]|nr:hypothetical protein CRUP_024434 [Coryphaenoides rupestris]